MSAATNSRISSLEERIVVLERINTALISEIRNLSLNDQVLGSALEAHDNLLAAARAFVVKRGILSEDEIERCVSEIEEMRRRAGQAQPPEPQNPANLQREDDGHPPEAFIFGG